jgi:hypothetical protein
VGRMLMSPVDAAMGDSARQQMTQRRLTRSYE